MNHNEPDRVPIYEGAIEPYDLSQGKPELYFQPGILHYSTDLMNILTKPYAKPGLKITLKLMSHPEIIIPFVKPAFMASSRLHRKFGIDMMGFVGGLPMITNPRLFYDFQVKNKTIYTPHGDIATKISDNFGAVSRFGFLRSPEDYEKYMEFNPDHPINYFLVQPGLKAAKGKIALQFTIYGAAFFETMCEMFGFTTFFKLLKREPNFVKKVVKDLSDYAIAQVEYCTERGAKLFYLSDDLGENRGLLISPKMYQSFFLEGISKYCKTVHKYGGKVIMHSCGNAWELVDTLVNAGIDALHPWQPFANMDIFEGKRKWGKRITLIGNVPIELLSQEGKQKEVVEYVKKLIREVAPSGGYILSSSHSIIPSVNITKTSPFFILIFSTVIFWFCIIPSKPPVCFRSSMLPSSLQ
jgi:uroporphyrinogen decarboxylase